MTPAHASLPSRALWLGLDAVRQRRSRRWVVAVAAVYLLVYLLAIQNVIVSPGTDLTRFVAIPSVRVVTDWPARLVDQIAPFSFEPVVAIYPVNHVTVLLAPLNLAMGLLLGGLVGINVTTALAIGRNARSCGRRAFPGILGALPGFLTGFACCVPTVALVLGAQFTLALVALRSFFFPFALLALLASLFWLARRTDPLVHATPGAQQEPATSTRV